MGRQRGGVRLAWRSVVMTEPPQEMLPPPDQRVLGTVDPGRNVDPAVYFASGSGRNWKCTALLVWPLPPSTCHGVVMP